MPILIVNRLRPEADVDELKKVIPEHISWLKEQISSGLVLQAGKWGSIGGITVIKGENVEEAEKIIREDPLIKSDMVTFESDIFFPMKEL